MFILYCFLRAQHNMNGFSDLIIFIIIIILQLLIIFIKLVADHGVNLSNGTIGIEYILEIH